MSVHALRRYSRYVSLMKVVLSLGIFCVLVFSLGVPYIFSSKGDDTGSSSREEPSDNRMIHPHYVATDNKGQPYQVTAERAVQTGENQPANLEKPQGVLRLSGGETLNVTAQEGTYDAKKEQLDLNGEVTLTSTDGSTVETTQATLLIKEKVIEGSAPIYAAGPRGTFESKNGFQIKHTAEGDIISLRGPSRVTIRKAKAPGG